MNGDQAGLHKKKSWNQRLPGPAASQGAKKKEDYRSARTNDGCVAIETADAARSGMEVRASTTMPTSGDPTGQDPYMGRTSGPNVQGSS